MSHGKGTLVDRPPSYEEIYPQFAKHGVTEISVDNFNTDEDRCGSDCSQSECNMRDILNNNNNNLQRHGKAPAGCCVNESRTNRCRGSRKNSKKQHTRRRIEYEDIPYVGAEQAKQKYIEHKTHGSCYRKPPSKLQIEHVVHDAVMEYTIQTTREQQKTSKETRPWTGSKVTTRRDSDVTYKPADYFKDTKYSFELPQSSSVCSCPNCSGAGQLTCNRCRGDGYEMCSACYGNPRTPCDFTRDTTAQGIYNSQDCSTCNGYGRVNCSRHCESGKAKCVKCDGHGKIEQFKKRSIIWRTKTDCFQNIGFDIPCEEIHKGKSKVIFEKEENSLHDIVLSDCIDQLVCDNANRLIREHQTYTDGKSTIVRQKHCIRLIPVTKVIYTKKNKQKSFFLLGFEQKFYKPSKCFSLFTCCFKLLN